MPLTRDWRPGALAGTCVCLVALVGAASCNQRSAASAPHRTTLRVGISNVPQLATERGVQQFVINQTNEGLLRVNQAGRIETWLAERWHRSPDGLRASIYLRQPAAKFHDGTSADATAVTSILNDQLGKTLKQWAADVDSIVSVGDREVAITFRRPSAFFIDALMDASIAKPGSPTIGVGAFKPAPPGQPDGAQVIAHEQYYEGSPELLGLAIKTYANIRSAWADMLRNQIDMLYEVGSDAIDTMRGASNVSLYTFDRPYQYLVFLNQRNPKLKSAKVRQALNQAIDRPALIKDALAGHGTPSAGPVSPHHWAFQPGGATFSYAPEAAESNLPKGLSLSCYTLAEPPFEQLALVLKQQLRAVGVDLIVKEAPLEAIISKLQGEDADAVLLDSASGWSLSRVFQRWHSTGSGNVAKFSNASVDAALDRINHAIAESEYRQAVGEFQEGMAADPPAMFLAWSDRSRAISTRFEVTQEPGRDVFATLRTWHPRTDNRNTTH